MYLHKSSEQLFIDIDKVMCSQVKQLNNRFYEYLHFTFIVTWMLWVVRRTEGIVKDLILQ